MQQKKVRRGIGVQPIGHVGMSITDTITMHGKLLRVPGREHGQWKFFPVMVAWKEGGAAEAR